MSDYDTDVATLAWQHNRSALVHLMLLDGYKYIMCEVADEDKDFGWMDSLDIYIITTAVENEDGSVTFVDIEGNVHTAVQPIKGSGNIMSFSDYIREYKHNHSRNVSGKVNLIEGKGTYTPCDVR